MTAETDRLLTPDQRRIKAVLEAELAHRRAQRITVRRRGHHGYPWEVRCAAHPEERLYIVPGRGAAAINTRGVGNRSWSTAMGAVQRHLEDAHTCRGCDDRQERGAGQPPEFISRRCPVHGHLAGAK